MQTGNPSVALSKPLSRVTWRRLPPCTTHTSTRSTATASPAWATSTTLRTWRKRIFIKMLNGLPNYQWRKVPFAAWLMRISHNEVITFTRRNGRRSQDTELPEDLLDQGMQNDPARERRTPTGARGPAQGRRAAAGSAARGDHPSLRVRPFYRRYRQGARQAEENNVKVLQHKGMQRLQTLMTPKYPELAQRQDR